MPGQLIEIELAKQVQLQAMPPEEESLTSLVDTTPPVEPTVKENVFDREFGRSGFSEGFDFSVEAPRKDEKLVSAD